jgi:hypothetical protein
MHVLYLKYTKQGGEAREEAQTIYTHVSKCKNNKTKNKIKYTK